MEEKIQENQINQPDLPRTPVTVEKKKVNPLTIVILLIAILLVGVGGVYAGMQISKKQTPTPLVSQPTVTPTAFVQPTIFVQSTIMPTSSVPTVTPNETVNWKTYKNEKYRFEIKYPVTWLVNLIDNTVRFQTFPEPSPGYGGFPGGTNDIQVSLSVKDNSGNLTLEKYFAQQSSGRLIKNKQSTVLGNISGIMATYDGEVNAGMPEIYSIIDNSLIEGTVYSGSDVKEKAISTFDQILSTFKFLE